MPPSDYNRSDDVRPPADADVDSANMIGGTPSSGQNDASLPADADQHTTRAIAEAGGGSDADAAQAQNDFDTAVVSSTLQGVANPNFVKD